jgi:hypothetical protein
VVVYDISSTFSFGADTREGLLTVFKMRSRSRIPGNG